MSNIYSTPEQHPLTPEIGRVQLVGEARFYLQNALFRRHPQMVADLAQRRLGKAKLVENTVAIPTVPPVAAEVPRFYAVPTANEATPPSVELTGQEADRQRLIEEAYQQINEAHAA